MILDSLCDMCLPILQSSGFCSLQWLPLVCMVGKVQLTAKEIHSYSPDLSSVSYLGSENSLLVPKGCTEICTLPSGFLTTIHREILIPHPTLFSGNRCRLLFLSLLQAFSCSKVPNHALMCPKYRPQEALEFTREGWGNTVEELQNRCGLSLLLLEKTHKTYAIKRTQMLTIQFKISASTLCSFV